MKKLFALMSLLMVLAMVFAACGGPAETAPEAETTTEEEAVVEEAVVEEEVEEPEAETVILEPPSAYSESPVLAEKVAAGELPPVDDRLPEIPYVVGPGTEIVVENLDYTIGRYGGTLRSAHKGTF